MGQHPQRPIDGHNAWLPGVRRVHGASEKGLYYQYFLRFVRPAPVKGLYLLGGKSRSKEPFAELSAGVGYIGRSRKCDSSRILSQPDDAREVSDRGADRGDLEAHSHAAIR